MTGLHPSLSDAAPTPYWQDARGLHASLPPLSGDGEADLAVVGGGFTGLWAAIDARRRRPDRDVLLLEADHIGFGASGRNGGFVSDSLTHGLQHGLERWPEHLPRLLEIGRENLADLVGDVARAGIEADVRLCGKTVVATNERQVSGLTAMADLLVAHGEDVEVLARDKVRADVASPTYLGGVRIRSGGGLVDPAALATGLRDLARREGVRIHEQTPVTRLDAARDSATLSTPTGEVRAQQVVLATNAFRPLVRRLRRYVIPVYDHVLVTEPLTPDQWRAIGWADRQGLTDLGNQFHYYRPTADGRILWGGYDAIYYYGGDTSAEREQRDASHDLLARQFLATFPQLEGIRFTHRWAGLIDTTSRFTPYVGTDRDRRVGHALGFTGLGVASSRQAARTVLDLLDGVPVDPAVAALMTKRPVPFPPEPLRYPTVQLTRAALAREDDRGRRGAWLRLLDRLGVGFNS